MCVCVVCVCVCVRERERESVCVCVCERERERECEGERVTEEQGPVTRISARPAALGWLQGGRCSSTGVRRCSPGSQRSS